MLIDALLQARHSVTRLAFGLAVGVSLFVLFTLRQKKQARPMLDPAVFASRAMVGVAALIAAVSMGYWAVLVYLPLFLHAAFGWTVQEAGLGLLAATLPMLIIPSFGGRIAAHLGWRWLFGMALTTMTMAGLALGVAAGAQMASAVVWVLGAMVVLGTGAALANPQLVGADPNLSHRADRILSQGWKPTLRWSAVDKFSS